MMVEKEDSMWASFHYIADYDFSKRIRLLLFKFANFPRSAFNRGI